MQKYEKYTTSKPIHDVKSLYLQKTKTKTK